MGMGWAWRGKSNTKLTLVLQFLGDTNKQRAEEINVIKCWAQMLLPRKLT